MHPLSPVVAVVGAGVALFAFSGSSGAAVSSVSGGAFGENVNITITGIGNVTDGPRPTVNLPASGGSANQTLASTSIGPAGLFLTSGALNVSTEGTTGATGTVRSGAQVANANVLQTLVASQVASSCTASESGTTGATMITNGTMILEGTTETAIPPAPAPNLTFNGTNADTGDQFTIVLNQQSTANGVLTVNAVNFILRGPTATGFVILGQSRCGVSATGTTSTTGNRNPPTTPSTNGGTTPTVSRTQAPLARTGAEAPLLPTLALVAVAIGASRWARRRPEAS